MLHGGDPHVGLVRFVVYLIVPSLTVQLTAIPDGPNDWLAGVHVGVGGGVISLTIEKFVPVIGHPQISVTLICTVVVHSTGVNAGVVLLVHKDVHDDHVLYSIVADDGHRVPHKEQLVVPA